MFHKLVLCGHGGYRDFLLCDMHSATVLLAEIAVIHH